MKLCFPTNSSVTHLFYLNSWKALWTGSLKFITLLYDSDFLLYTSYISFFIFPVIFLIHTSAIFEKSPNTNFVLSFSLISILSVSYQGWKNTSAYFFTLFPTEIWTNMSLVFLVLSVIFILYIMFYSYNFHFS